ncbi:ParB/RepB/Spo0J family partition protein [Saccharothrix australiensis]|uniref:ParB/RepB/Spo0J family partition protein n=1 Tax=Saccharothrix australiensis TaxID=2072 RepID=UPI001FEAA282|nr:ParB N-terminal domain-containing protein [Saccharothrix australiensis]
MIERNRSGDKENALDGLSPAVDVPVEVLLPADSPRLDGESDEHVRMLAAIEGPLPPIIVHRPTMRVIDGMHRVRAALLRGDGEVAARFYDGDEESAFVRAVKANVTHGLPLSQADREAAARRIIGSHPEWSDRSIAAATGMAAETVAALRRRSGDRAAQPIARIGRDGRVRPLSSAEGRRKAGELFADRPGATLREVARAAGISVGTARDVRDRVRRGEDPLPDRVREREAGAPTPPTALCAAPALPDGDFARLLDNLRRDPTLRLTESGRALLRLLTVQAMRPEDWGLLVRATPAHCLPALSKLARGCADKWAQLAEEFDERARATA